MDDLVNWSFACATGIVLGAMFFGGLWWTTRRGMVSRQPAIWFLGSFVLRTGVVLFGFYLVADMRWQSIALCLLGFVFARFAVIRMIGPPEEGQARGGGHAA